MEQNKEASQQKKFDSYASETEEDRLFEVHLGILKILRRRKELGAKTEDLIKLSNDSPINEKNDILRVSELQIKPTLKK